MTTGFRFDITTKTSGARVGVITTPHGIINTPNFIPCGTMGAITGITSDQLRDIGCDIFLSNTYHLEIFPGSEQVQAMGGLQEMTGWRGPMLTDSGGYQVFAMGHGSVSQEIKGKIKRRKPTLRNINEKGAKFQSYWDSSIQNLTAERSIQIQHNLGADLILVFDECTPFNVSKEYTEASMERSHRWASRSIAEFQRIQITNQALYGIVQGGTYPDLRQRSTQFNNEQEAYFGIAVGGSLGSDKQTMYNTVELTMAMLRKDKPVHLLGIGGLADIFHGVRHGIDTFDCVHPTRLARHGGALVRADYWQSADPSEKVREHIDLTKSRFKDDMGPIDANCGCATCRGGIKRAYLHYLLKRNCSTAGTHISIHNLYFMNWMMKEIREGIVSDNLDEVESRWLAEPLKWQNRQTMNIGCD